MAEQEGLARLMIEKGIFINREFLEIVRVVNQETEKAIKLGGQKKDG